MLPFMQKRKTPMVIVEQMKTTEEPESDKDYQIQAVEAAAQDLITAIASKNVRAVAEALRAAFEICDSMPHEEGPHTNDEEV